MDDNDSYDDVSDGNVELEDVLQSSDDDDDVEQEILASQTQKRREEIEKKKQIGDLQQTEFENLLQQPNLLQSQQQQQQQQKQEDPGQKNENTYENILRRKRKQREEEEEALYMEKERKENKLNAINPLDMIDKEQGEIMNNDNQLFQNFDKELILSRTRLPSDYNMEYTNLEGLSSYLYPQLGVEQEFMSNKNYGLPKAMCVLPNKLLIIGTSYGMVIMFDINSYKIVQVIGTYDDYRKFGSVCTIDVNKEGDAIVVGFEKGGISLYETYSGNCIKQILGVHENTILTAKFWKGRERFISSDLSGNIYLFKIEKVWLVTYSFDKQRLLKKPENPSEIIYGVEILSEKHFYNTELSRTNNTTVALCSAVSVVIITLEPSVKKLYEIERPTFLQSPSLPCVSWGRGRAPYQTMDNMDYPILAVGWGPLIQLYQMNKFGIMQISTQQNVISEGFDIIGHLILDHTIFHLQWISFSMLYTLNSRNEFRIIYTGEAVGGQFQGDASDAFSQVSSQLPSATNIESANTLTPLSILDQKPFVKHNYHMEQEINFVFLVKDTQNKPKRTFSNSIVVSNQDVYISTSKCIIKGHFFEWKECIYKYVKQKKWTIALRIAMQLQYGKLQSFARLPDKIDPVQKRDFIETCEKLFLSYLEKEKHRIENYVPNSDKSDEIQRYSKICFEYLIEIRDFETLFRDARKAIMELDSNEKFHFLLEPFILRNKIKRIPQEYFNYALLFFLEKKKFNVVQIMIVNLDLNSIDQYETLKQCVQHQLFTPLIYISTRKDNDFISSLEKMYYEYQEAQRKSNDNKSGQKYVYRCLWFIRLTIQQKLYPNETIEESKFPTALRTVVSWFFSDQIIVDFAKVDSSVYFEVVYLLFIGKPSNILRDKDPLLFKYFIYDSDMKDQKDVVQYQSFIHEQMIKKIYKLLRVPMNQDKNIKKNFFQFIGKIAHFQDISINLTICRESAEFLLSDNSSITTEREIQNKQSDILALVKRMRKSKEFLDGLLDLIPKIDRDSDLNLNKMQEDVEQDINNLQKDPSQKGKVQKMIEDFKEFQKQRFIQEKVNLEILAYCEYLTGDLYRAFEQYQRMMEQTSLRGNRYKIFTWLYEAFRNEELKESQKEQLKKYILQNIRIMLITSTRQTKNIVNTFLKEKEKEIFESLLSEQALPGDQTLLLDYLECLIEDSRQKSNQQNNNNSSQNPNVDNSINNDILALYITMLCKVEPSRVVQELKTNNYPLETIKLVCKLNNAHDAVAYISVQFGEHTEAVKLYSKIFLEECQKTFQRITKGRHIQFQKEKQTQSQLNHVTNSNINSIQQALNIKFQQLIETCKAWSAAETQEKSNKNIWLDTVSDILSCKEAQLEDKELWREIADYINEKKIYYEVVNQIFSNIIAKLFIEVSNHLSIQDLIKLVEEYEKQFSFHSIKESFTQILTTLSEEIIFLDEGKQVLLQDLKNQNQNFLKKTTQGSSFGVHCSHPSCGNHINNYSSNVIVFSCGHQYHQRCLDINKSYSHSSRRKQKAAGQQQDQSSQKVYKCSICLKEEYLQQIEFNLFQISQKLQNNTSTTSFVINDNNNATNQVNKDQTSSQYQGSQNDSKSIMTDRSKKDIKDERQKFRQNHLVRLKVFDNYIKKDMDNFDRIRSQYDQSFS